MYTIQIDGQEINYAHNKAKADGGPTLLLVHGAGGRCQSWPYQWQEDYAQSATRRRWISDFPIYTVDLPGHGKSSLPGRDSIGGYADFIERFIEQLGLTNVVVGGHSMGGGIAQEIGLRNSTGVVGVVLIATGARMPVTDLILDGLLTDFPKTVAMIMKFSWTKGVTTNFTQVATGHMLGTPPEVVHGDFYACNQFDYREQLPELSLPTLVIGGEFDKMMPVKNAEFLAEHIPDAELVVIKGAGHFMQVEKTAKVSKAIVKFLQRIDPGPS